MFHFKQIEAFKKAEEIQRPLVFSIEVGNHSRAMKYSTYASHAAFLNRNQGEGYEMIREGQACVGYFDLDCSDMAKQVNLARTSIETFVRIAHDQVARAIVDVVNEFLPEVYLSTDDVIALDATSEMKDKLSQHYIIRPLTYELVWPNNKTLKQVTEKVNESLFNIKLDDKVYTNNRLFRILGACKLSDENIPGRRLSQYGSQDRTPIEYFVTYQRENVPHVKVPYEELPLCSIKTSTTTNKRKACSSSVSTSELCPEYLRAFKCLRKEIPELSRQEDKHISSHQEADNNILCIRVVAKNNTKPIECPHKGQKHSSNTSLFCCNIRTHIGWFSCYCTPGKTWGKQDCTDLIE